MTQATTESPSAPAASIVLTALEARVLGCLVEKAATTPDNYPLTLNAVHLACNQKTSRSPIMDVEIGEVGHTLRTLEEKKLVRMVHGARAMRYEHTIDAPLELTPRSRAVIAVLLLRGAQTQAELHTRCARLADFPDNAMLDDTLDRLITREPALVVRIGRGSGQREDRYMHLLCGPASIQDLQAQPADSAAGRPRTVDLQDRIEALERAVAKLQEKVGLHDPDAASD